MSKSLSFYNLTGGLNTVQDLATINSTPNRTESPDMMNIEYYKLGGIQTMRGNTQIGQTLEGETITCGIEYILGNESYMVITTSLDNVYEYNKVTKEFTYIGTMEKDQEYIGEYNPRHSMVPYNNGIVIVNGYSVGFYNRRLSPNFSIITPTLHTTESEEYIIRPSTVASYKGRLFLGANNVVDKKGNSISMLFYSGVGLGTQTDWGEDPGTGDDAGAYKEFYEDTSYFTGLGTWAEYLVIHKEQNTYLLDGTAYTSDEWELKPYSEYTVPSQQSFVVANNSYYTYVPEAGGIYPILGRTIYNTTYQGSELSFKIKDSFDYLDIDRYNEIYATFNPRRKQILFYMPMIDNINERGEFNGSGECFIYDIQTKTWLYRKVPQYVTCAFKFENETYIGTKDGKVLQEFKGKTFDGEPIDFYYLTPPFIWGGGTNKTTTKEFRVKMLNSSANHFYVESFKDGNLESKERRLIKNVNDNLGGLVWDLDYNYPNYDNGNIIALNDFNPANFTKVGDYYYINKINADVYHYVINGEDYYSRQQITNTSTNIPLYKDIDLTDFVKYNQYLYEIVDEQTQGYSPITTYETRTAYAWVPKKITSYCYKYGNYYAWISPNDITGRCTTNLVLITQPTTNTTKTAFQVVNYSNNPSGIVAVNTSDYNNYWNTPNRSLYAYLRNESTGSWSHTQNGNEIFVNTSNQPNGSAWKDNRGRSVFITTGSVSVMIGGVSYRMQQYDEVQNIPTNTEQPQGTSPLNITKLYTQSGDTITINVQGVGNITLTRYEAGDEFELNGTLVYTKSETPEVSVDYGYSNTNMSSQIGLVTSSSDNTITVATIVHYRYSQADTTYSQSIIKYSKPLIDSDTPYTIESGTKPVYDYPPRPTEDKIKSLTDTVWDYSNIDEPYIPEADLPDGYNNYNEIPDNLKGDAWLQEGYQTKRILLPNQYFETVQFKFSGSGDNDSICISGFEVDGIQLAETPWQ